jgi:hypothetical protein
MQLALSPSSAPPPVRRAGQLSKNSRQGVRSCNPALHPGQFVCNSRTAIGLRWACSGTASDPVEAPSKGQTWSQFGQAAKSCAASSFGLSTAAAGGAVASGLNVVSTAGKFSGMTAGTSVASQFFRGVFPQAIGSTWAPTISNPLATSGTLGGVIGRWVPVIGEAVLVYQGAKFVSCLYASDDTPWVIGGSQ